VLCLCIKWDKRERYGGILHRYHRYILNILGILERYGGLYFIVILCMNPRYEAEIQIITPLLCTSCGDSKFACHPCTTS
jgi:hypothetical protein